MAVLLSWRELGEEALSWPVGHKNDLIFLPRDCSAFILS
jgi:hypothetical protein